MYDIQPGQELSIFYGHKLWFAPSEGTNTPVRPVTPEDGWGGLGVIEADETMEIPDRNTTEIDPRNPYEGGDPDDTINEEDLPFTRFKPVPEEETLESIRTGMYQLTSFLVEPYPIVRSLPVEAWVVDVPEPKHLGPLIKCVCPCLITFFDLKYVLLDG